MFRDEGPVVKQTFIMQPTQTHMRAHHDLGSREVRAQNRALTRGHTEQESGRCREQGVPAAAGTRAHARQGAKARVAGGAPRKVRLMGEDHPKAGRPREEPRVRPQQSYRTTQTAQKGEPPQSRALHLEKVTLAAEVSLTEEAREDVRRRSPARRPWAQ